MGPQLHQSEVIILGAGIAGVSTAHFLRKKYAQKDILILDRSLPLNFTTSKSGENFRSYWPQNCMTALVRRSLHLMEDLASHSEVFELRYSGYEYVSEREQKAASDVSLEFFNEADVRITRPYLSGTIKSLKRIPQAGDFDVHSLGTTMLSGIQHIQAEITAISFDGELYSLRTDNGQEFRCRSLVLASGPFLRAQAEGLGATFPAECFLQQKIVLPDPLKVVPSNMPFTIFEDPQRLAWSPETKELLATDPDYSWMLEEFPGGLHIKPEAGGQIKLGWAFNRTPTEPGWQPRAREDFPRLVLLGASRFIPGLSAYCEDTPTPVISYAGYYTRTKENWPLIGPLELPRLYAVGALSGFGTMAACAAGELCADLMMDGEPQDYWRYFHPKRYEDPQISSLLAELSSDGQL